MFLVGYFSHALIIFTDCPAPMFAFHNLKKKRSKCGAVRVGCLLLGQMVTLANAFQANATSGSLSLGAIFRLKSFFCQL